MRSATFEVCDVNGESICEPVFLESLLELQLSARCLPFTVDNVCRELAGKDLRHYLLASGSEHCISHRFPCAAGLAI